MTVSPIQPSEAATCQTTRMSAGNIHPTHDHPGGTLSRRIAAESRGHTLATDLSAMSVN
jgi:hypothetical protein